MQESVVQVLWSKSPRVIEFDCPPIKLDHFLDFANRPYFYQDLSFRTRKLRLSSGEKITMPNVIRKVTRSTMVKQYLQFCEEEQFEPLSRSTLFRILEVREAYR